MHADPRLVGGVLIGMIDPVGLRWADAHDAAIVAAYLAVGPSIRAIVARCAQGEPGYPWPHHVAWTLRTETVVQILRSYAPKKPKKGQRTAHALLADLALMVSAFGWSKKMTREKARKTIQVDMARRKRLSDSG